MKNKICQSCGMPMMAEEQFGTNDDGSVNTEYCTYCYQDGAFTGNYTMNEMIDHNLEFLDEFNKDVERPFTREEARAEMRKFFPTLKRWKN
ncbi:zinc ribbon domain-containing protein [Butyricimonas sp. Marseille-P3923]|uniref:zinc ribbon domain-containing protein n=1 Tax=Butyricimonas sp. Marseille-P3923 TaxID=1987504 RepID=UPI000C069CF0|nr:zinc ribbon domain-containing protein [Butyricimonas sp. Marseille-P3923]